ncbi:hypothetical protein [Ulvibacter antarcticus]|nr:hypothetical protein [Ulvibacter antarcticus]
MKKLFFASVFALGMVTAVNAQTDEKQPTAMNETPVKAMEVSNVNVAALQDYKEIKATDLPQEVKDAVATSYDDATIANAYTNEKGLFKLVLSGTEDADSLDDTTQTVYLNQNGEFIEKQ